MKGYFIIFALLLSVQTVLGQTAPTAATIYKQAAPSVVSIEAYNDQGQVGWTGTGFIVATDGEILTNYHVIRNSKQATVRLSNGDAYDSVAVLDVDTRKDIALLKIKAVDLPSLHIEAPSAYEIGDAVYTLSNPLGLDNSLSAGIVSGIRDLDGYRVVQITAPISHGSSGGPVFNAQGQVIGIAVASLQDGQNLNFAIPIVYARGMLASPDAARPLAAVYDPEPQETSAAAAPASTDTGTKAQPNTPDNAVVTMVTLDSLQHICQEMGFQCKRDKIGSVETIFFMAEGITGTVPNPATIVLDTFFTGGKPNLATVNEWNSNWNSNDSFITALLDESGEAILNEEISVAGGVTVQHIEDQITSFGDAVARFPTFAVAHQKEAKQSFSFLDGNTLYADCQEWKRNTVISAADGSMNVIPNPDNLTELAQVGVCSGYITAVVDSILIGEGFDPDPDVRLNQYVDVVLAYLEAHPETRHLPAYRLTRIALTEAFPQPTGSK